MKETSSLVLLLSLVAVLPALSMPGARADASSSRAHHETPRLVVGIVVDQMRYDFLYRYWDKYGDDGFKQLLNDGFSFDHALYDYGPTFTGPGHASIYTGATPATHGLMDNRWFLRDERRQTYVVEDLSVQTVGSSTAAGQMSPRWLLTTTIADELRLHTNMRSRAIGVSLKDRGAILPVGHTGEAYWFDHQDGVIVTSTFYRDELPGWVEAFNERDLVGRYLSEPWEPLLPIEEYTESLPYNQPSAAFRGQESPHFPHDLPRIAEEMGRGVLGSTPFGDKLVVDLARAAIEGEALGEGPFPDLLAISFSAPDLIGHQFGAESCEVQDTYLRLDREIGEFLRYLDERFGRENILVFFSSDHGAAPLPTYMKELNVPAGYFSQRGADEKLREHLTGLYGVDPVLAFRRFQVYLDREVIGENGLSLAEVEEETARFLITLEGMADALTATTLRNTEFRYGSRARMQKGFNHLRSGDVVYWLQPQWIIERASGTTHGSPFTYDTRVPLIWYGWDIPAGRSVRPAFITDIAPTLAIILNTPYPSGSEGNPLNDWMR